MTLIITKPRLDSFTAALNGIAKILTIQVAGAGGYQCLFFDLFDITNNSARYEEGRADSKHVKYDGIRFRQLDFSGIISGMRVIRFLTLSDIKSRLTKDLI